MTNFMRKLSVFLLTMMFLAPVFATSATSVAKTKHSAATTKVVKKASKTKHAKRYTKTHTKKHAKKHTKKYTKKHAKKHGTKHLKKLSK